MLRTRKSLRRSSHVEQFWLSYCAFQRFRTEFCLSVVCQSVRRKKLKSRHIDRHKPSKGSQTIANSKKLLYVYLTEVKALRFAAFRLFPTFHNYS